MVPLSPLSPSSQTALWLAFAGLRSHPRLGQDFALHQMSALNLVFFTLAYSAGLPVECHERDHEVDEGREFRGVVIGLGVNGSFLDFRGMDLAAQLLAPRLDGKATRLTHRPHRAPMAQLLPAWAYSLHMPQEHEWIDAAIQAAILRSATEEAAGGGILGRL